MRKFLLLLQRQMSNKRVFLLFITQVVVAALIFLQLKLSMRENCSKQCAKLEIKSEQDVKRWNEECPTKGGGPRGVIITIYPGGRLGNLVWEYLSVWSYAQRYGVWPAVPGDILHKLRERAFTNLTIPSVEKLTSRCKINHLMQEFKKYEFYGNVADLPKALKYEDNKNVSLIIIRRYSAELEHTIFYWRELADQLIFKKEYLESSQKELRSIKKEMRQRSKLKAVTSNHNYKSDITYVAVHVRRTDSLTAKISLHHPVANETFYFQALNEMRRRLNDQDIVFVVVSDDPEWCKTHLTDPDTIIAGDGDIKSPGHDLALLASCNHSIFPYSSFALTASLFNNDKIAIVDKHYLDLKFPNWILI